MTTGPHQGMLARIRASPRLREPGWLLLPLRLFLGVTFCYASLLKLTDSTYLDAASPNSVQAQMLRAAATSPIGALVSLSAHAATVTGLLIAFGELAVGVGVLLGVWTRLAALGGIILSLSFFLTVSWATRPYFYGSDIVFVFAWTPLLMAGDGGVYSVVGWLRARVRRELGVQPGRPVRAAVAAEVERRTLVQTGIVAGGLAVVGALVGAAGALRPGRRPTRASASGAGLGAPSTAPTSSSPAATSSAATASGSASHSASPGKALGPASQVPVGGSATFTDANNGQPGIVVQPSTGRFKAFSAVCPHQGCTVQFQSGSFFCPCHGSQFDGATGAVLSGPSPSGLPTIPIVVSGGTIYET